MKYQFEVADLLLAHSSKRKSVFLIYSLALESSLKYFNSFRSLRALTSKVSDLVASKGIPVVGGAVASWLVRSSPDRAFRVRALARDTVLCSWARHLTLTVPLSTQVYKWVPANLMLGVTLRWTSIPSRGE